MSSFIIYSKGLPANPPPPAPVSGIDVYMAGTYNDCQFTLDYNNGVSPQTDVITELNINTNPVNITIVGNLTITTDLLPPDEITGGGEVSQIQCPDMSFVNCYTSSNTTVYSGITIIERDNTYTIVNTFTYTVPFAPNVATKFIEIMINSTTTSGAGFCEDC